MILVRSHEAMMEEYRRQAHRYHGDDYGMRISRFLTLIQMQMIRYRDKDSVECAEQLMRLMRANKKKLSVHVKSLLYSAALDLREMKWSPPTVEAKDELGE